MAKVKEKIQVAQHLKLLADFFADVMIPRMKGFEVRFERIHILRGERFLVKRVDGHQNVKRPAM
ncbi:MAG: hypothetical protein RL380_885 [Verrucomicrobiota bacterium]